MEKIIIHVMLNFEWFQMSKNIDYDSVFSFCH